MIEKSKRITGPTRERVGKRLAAAYGKGQSIRAIAAEEGRSYGFVHRVLVESGANLRSRGGARPKS